MITPFVHGFIDYLYAVLLTAAPILFGFDEGSTQAYAVFIAAAVVMGYSVFTKYPLGIFKLLSFRTHLVMDVAVSVLLIASPWLFGLNERSFLPFVLLGAAGLSVVLLTSTNKDAFDPTIEFDPVQHRR